MVVTSHHLFMVFQASIINTIHIINQSSKYGHIYRVLTNSESDNMDLFPYNFDLEYYIEEINSRQQIAIATATEPPTFLCDSNIFSQRLQSN
jgi:hypothetical protein